MIDYDVNYEKIFDATGDFVLIVLNESLNSNKSKNLIFQNLWKKAKKRVLVDGASNWLFENYESFGDPDYICGDLDSISKEALKFFEKKISTSRVLKLANQDETDFDKSISFCLNQFKEEKFDEFIVTWGQKDRIDHNLACISTLIKYSNQNSLPIYLIDVNSSLSCVLDKTKKIKINKKSKWCSIVPVGEPCTISTTGFKWNLKDFTLKFGELISTSNEFDLNQDYCTIQTDKPIFFSMHLSND